MSPRRKSDAHGNAARILIADPDQDTRSFYGEALGLTGCEIVGAPDGRDALVIALSQLPMLVITETSLPILDGFALCEALRRDSMTRTVPILVVTAQSGPTELDRARAAGADAVLIKPVTLEALLSEIQGLLRRPGKSSDEPRSSRGTRERSPKHCADNLITTAAAGLELGTPLRPPPDLICPSCDRPLIHQHTHVGGVKCSPPEQWDYYTCAAPCGGAFVYRHRTRQLRRTGGGG